jgi:branched-chain amino acid transport system permease protein
VDLLGFLVTESVNALSQAALLFFLGVGLTLIFGIMRIINFAHASFYMLGAFIGYSAARLTGSFWLALAPLAVGIVGTLFELGVLRRLYRRDESAFLMVTFGLALVLGEIIRLSWGPEALQVEPPAAFSGVIFLFDEPFPTYRLFLIGAGIVVARV